MPETYGDQESRLYYVVETNFGVLPVNPAYVKVDQDDLTPGVDPGLVEVRGAGSRDVQSLKRGLRISTLKFGSILPSASPMHLIQHALTLSSLSFLTAYYKGAWAWPPSDYILLQHHGMKIDQLDVVNAGVDSPLRVNLSLLGQNTEEAVPSGPTFTEYTGALMGHESYFQKDLVDDTRASDWKFTIKNNLRAVPVIRSSSGYIPKYVRERHRELSGEVTFEFESNAELTQVLADTEFSLKFGLGPSNYALLEGCKWDAITVPSKIEDLIFSKAPFRAKTVTFV